MPIAEDFVEAEEYVDQAQQMSGAAPQRGMAPYPLYGLQGLGQEETATPFWKAPWFCYTVGGAAGFGLGWAFFTWFKPKFMKKNPGKRKAKKEAEG